jgi:hypothetical protein
VQINSQLNDFIAQLSQSGQNGKNLQKYLSFNTKSLGATSEITNIRELQFPFNVGNNEDEEMDNEQQKPNEFMNNGNGQIIAE